MKKLKLKLSLVLKIISPMLKDAICFKCLSESKTLYGGGKKNVHICVE